MFAAPRLLLLTGPESLILAGSGAVLGAVLAAHFGRWSSSSARLVGAVAAAFVASTLFVAPVTAWAMISDIRASHRLSSRDAERFGPEESQLDTSVIDRVAAIIPSDATYAVSFWTGSIRIEPPFFGFGRSLRCSRGSQLPIPRAPIGLSAGASPRRALAYP